MKKGILWIVPMSVAIFLTFYHIFGDSQPRKEVFKNTMKSQNVRKSVIAGTWYPGNAEELREQIETYFENSKKADISGKIIGLIAPHAGYPYSGFIAANSYKQVLNNSYDAVIILAPSHREAFEGASVYTGDGFETPLGIVPVHEKLADEIINADESIYSSMDGHREEHSLEIQLPLLQVAVPNLKIVPIAMVDYSLKNCTKLADAITKASNGKEILLVASTDLYHGYSYDECVQKDGEIIQKILDLKPEELCDGIAKQEYMACGGGPVVVVEMVAKNLGANKTKLLYRKNSADVTGKKSGYVVGYAAIAIYKQGNVKEQAVGIELGLNPEDKKKLLTIAREAIEYGVERKSPPAVKFDSPIMKEKRGAFVTLTKKGSLRGCIGYIVAVKPLAVTIQEMAAAAAFRDPRFNPVKNEELNELEIEISVLTPLQEITDINEIEVGKHGLIIERGANSGLLLPQVATDYGWDRNTFLEHTCKKAGLPENAWKDPQTTIKIFSAEIFHESE